MVRPSGGLKPVLSVVCCVSFALLLLAATGLDCAPADIIPITSGTVIPGDNDGASTGNVPPSFTFLEPDEEIFANPGEIINLVWTDSDPDNNALITIVVDPNLNFGDGDEITVAPIIFEDDPANVFALDTSTLPEATYRIIARVNDAVNAELLAVAPGTLNLLGEGFQPGNRAPQLVVTQPNQSLGVLQGDMVDIAYCGSDVDDGAGGQTPDVLVMLDQDTNPNNDLQFTSSQIGAICSRGFFPQDVGGALVLGCFTDDDCTAVANATVFPLTIDVGVIPPRPGGEPYYPRVSMWDETNRPVHSYSPGTISINALASGGGSGMVDLGQVGRTLLGTRFIGNDAGALAGFTGVGTGDMTGDGVGDLAIVSRYGRPFGLNNNVGMVHFILGLPGGQKFGGEVFLNSVTTNVDGTIYTMPSVSNNGFSTFGRTEGITTITRIGDVNGDGLNEFMVGMPFIETFPDSVDDDPCDPSEPDCYFDSLPNPLATPANCDSLGIFDDREAVFDNDLGDYLPDCSNDFDPIFATPISGGYTVIVSSEDVTSANIISLASLGQNSDESGSPIFPRGARFRGPWYPLRFIQPELPYSITPDNEFGRTVASMPNMTNTSLTQPPDEGPALLISAPNSGNARGAVVFMFGQNFTNFHRDDPEACTTQSHPGHFCPGGRGLIYPGFDTIFGEQEGDRLGGAHAAGDYNLDGSRDIACGAPGADRNGMVDNGVMYVIFGRPDFTDINLETLNAPRMEIHGTASGQRLGHEQKVIGDMNQDGLPDIGFSTPYASGMNGEAEAGFVGILFGGRPLTGENIFTLDQLDGPQLPGVRIYGTVAGSHMGIQFNSADDFNGDGNEDMLVLSPGETRVINGQTRHGVAYLIFGGPHLQNGPFTIDQVGSAELPGLVFVSPYVAGTADEASIDFAASAGDVNADGFADVLLGISQADFVNPIEPSQRRIDSGEAYLIYGNNTGSNDLGP